MRNLYFILGHIDDFEISCLGYLFRHHKKYNNIFIIISSTWDKKVPIWEENLKLIQEKIPNKIFYKNLGFKQRRLMQNIDDLKDSLYGVIDFKGRFDIVTHDENDCHTDHRAVNMVSRGLFKYTGRFVSIYSPSSVDFRSNYWIGLYKSTYDLKKVCMDKYNIENEESYTKSGYYMQNEEHYNIGKSYYIENFVHHDYEHYESYRIVKWLE